jgi:hypothetical protein
MLPRDTLVNYHLSYFMISKSCLSQLATHYCSKQRKRLDKLLERTVERRAERLDLLVEVNGSLSTLGNAFWGELEFLGIC